jgi:hypothetical protein
MVCATLGKTVRVVEIVRASDDDVSRGDVALSTVHSPYYCLEFLNNEEGDTNGEVPSGP